MRTSTPVKLSKESKQLLAEAQRTCDALRATCKDVRRSLGHGAVAEFSDSALPSANPTKRRPDKFGGDGDLN